MVGAVAALASNLFFGQGPWTPWQMAGWGIAGLIGAGLARVWGRELGRVPLALACAGASLVYGAVQNLSLWITFSGDHSLAKLWFYVAGVVRVRRRARARQPAVLPRLRAGARARAAALPDALRGHVASGAGRAGGGAARARRSPPSRRAPTPPSRRAPIRYLERVQNADGGFGPAPRAGSTQMHTGWAALGLAAAGRNPRDVAPRRQQRDRLHERERRQAARRPRRALADDPRPARRRPARGAARRPRPRRGDRARAGAGRVVRRAREHDGVRGARAARGRPRHGRPGGEARGDVHRRPGQPRRRLQLRREGRAVGRRRHRRRPAGARRGGPPRLAGRAPGGALARPPPERRRRLLAPGRSEQRAVDGVGGPGAGRRRAATRPACVAAARAARSRTCGRSSARTARSATRAPAPRPRSGSPRRR